MVYTFILGWVIPFEGVGLCALQSVSTLSGGI